MIVEIEMGIQRISDQIGEWGEKLKLGNFWIAKTLGEILVADFTENGEWEWGKGSPKGIEFHWDWMKLRRIWNGKVEFWGGKGFSRVFDLGERRIGGKERKVW